MRVVTRQERGEAVQARGLTGIPDGSWLIGLEGHASTMVVTDDDFRARFTEDTTETTVKAVRTTPRRGRNGRELLTVPPAHPPLKAGAPISDRILSTVGTTPMAAKDIVNAVGGNPSNTRSALVRMAKNGALKSTGRGMYQLGRVAR